LAQGKKIKKNKNKQKKLVQGNNKKKKNFKFVQGKRLKKNYSCTGEKKFIPTPRGDRKKKFVQDENPAPITFAMGRGEGFQTEKGTNFHTGFLVNQKGNVNKIFVERPV